MKLNAKHPFRFGMFLIVFSISLMAQALGTGSSAGAVQSAAAAPSQDQPDAAASKPHNDSFIIGNDDMLAISVWKEPDLTKSIPVRSDGKISMPLVGEIQATGRTPLQLEEDIAAKLQSFITAPEVTVIVEQVNSKKFNILGEVSKPGSYSLALAPTVVDAIATAGGLRDFAKRNGIYILRQDAGGKETRIPFNYKDFLKGKHIEQNIKLEPRDTIIVP
jgi:polysaccharide export outer membrane protein